MSKRDLQRTNMRSAEWETDMDLAVLIYCCAVQGPACKAFLWWHGTWPWSEKVHLIRVWPADCWARLARCVAVQVSRMMTVLLGDREFKSHEDRSKKEKWSWSNLVTSFIKRLKAPHDKRDLTDDLLYNQSILTLIALTIKCVHDSVFLPLQGY